MDLCSNAENLCRTIEEGRGDVQNRKASCLIDVDASFKSQSTITQSKDRVPSPQPLQALVVLSTERYRRYRLVRNGT